MLTVDRVEVLYFRLPKRRPFRTSFGEHAVRHVILCVANADGLTGWGECVMDDDPGYCYETVETVWHMLSRFLASDLMGKPLETPFDAAATWARRRGHPLAKAGLEAAVWDLLAQANDLSLADYIWQQAGLDPKQRPDRVSVGVSIGIQPSIEETFAQIDEFLGLGYGRIKLKIEPGWDVEMARAVRARYPDIRMMLDANSAYTLDDAAHLSQFDDLNLLMLEQPLYHDDIYLHSLLAPQIKSPLCLDESIHNERDARAALDLGACRIINIKPARVGGLSQAVRIHNLCRERGVPVWCGGMEETGIGRAANVAVASLPGYTLPGDISASDRYFERDIITDPFVLNREDSTLSVRNGLGLSAAPDEAFIRELVERRIEIA
jgi:O-succinylbenzoate synthase